MPLKYSYKLQLYKELSFRIYSKQVYFTGFYSFINTQYKSLTRFHQVLEVT